ncbi:MAG: HupE/UreJ family protein [Akkermansiaceae bacterium]|nr:HupE/UreJ family protein [Akkermansiaceae bacterium]MDP4780657.1 HupE/UreJ family protein [Akkermansiaceae bacterium]MDP4898310.1 HupE/UreJ family protein [Akkermansiaceae bacterium]MDP4997278.1 HupE/UreJ family protein [Akkermansiaceae bacterium]
MKFAALFTHLFAWLFLQTASAHQVDTVELELLRTDGKWKLEGLLDIAYMMPESRGVEGAPPLFRKDVMAAPEQEHDRIVQTTEHTMRQLLKLQYNGKELKWDIRFPDFEEEPLVLPPEEGGWALMKAEITVDQQTGPGEFTASWHDNLESTLIVIIEEGENIGLLSISSDMSDTLLKVSAPAPGETEIVATTPTRSSQAESWIILGFGHVISHDFFQAILELRAPEGLDHLLFILGLFLLAPKWKPLMGQSLLFTVAHSITLALAIFGMITLPSRLIEILIAASIAWIGIENLLVKKLKPSRLILVFAFGLLHGMGFASMLRDKLGDLSGKQVALPLVGFNVGVELAQITVLACAFLILLPLKKYTKHVQTVGSVIVALAGLFWMFERIFA